MAHPTSQRYFDPYPEGIIYEFVNFHSLSVPFSHLQNITLLAVCSETLSQVLSTLRLDRAHCLPGLDCTRTDEGDDR